MTTIVLIGCGNMGYAMLKGWRAETPAPEVHVVEPAEALRLRAATTGAHPVATPADLPAGLAADIVVLAVKPAMVAKVLAECHGLAARGATFVSVAAGIQIPQMAAALPTGAPIIRCMPNTPAAIGQGMMVLCKGPTASDEACALTETLMASSGAVTWIDDESLMDAVTAISGSGPAYVFHFIEALTEAGTALGLPCETAALLAGQTVAGAGAYAKASDDTPTILREQVTSPNGTTAAALEVMMKDRRFTELMIEATTAARDRGIALGKGG
jgi:pyrroline-5-carboxylate reductase